jgi:hypothetical protein
MTILADLLVPFCDASSLNIKDASRSLRKRIVVSLAFVENEQLHKDLFKDQYLDWCGVSEYLQEISYTISDWIQLIKLLDFVQEITASSDVSEIISTTFAGVRVSAAQTKKMNPIDSLRLCFAKIKMSPSWDLLCKTFIACNLSDIDQLQILQALFAIDINKDESDANINNNIRELVRYMASCKHTKSEYSDSFASIMDDAHCQVRSHEIILSIKKQDEMKETIKNNAIKSGAAFKKPSLTQYLEIKSLEAGAQHPQDGFASFCRSSKIASNANLRIKHTAYFLLCLPDDQVMDRNSELARIVDKDQIILSNLRSIKILSPDVQELRRIIMDTHYTTTPSDSLRKFKDKCVASCLTMTRTLNWTIVMRLYMAAYCRQEISKDLWCFVLANSSFHSQIQHNNSLHMSSDSDSTVRTFVKGNIIDLHEIIEVMLMDI